MKDIRFDFQSLVQTNHIRLVMPHEPDCSVRNFYSLVKQQRHFASHYKRLIFELNKGLILRVNPQFDYDVIKEKHTGNFILLKYSFLFIAVFMLKFIFCRRI
jgi:hypothetical protein